MPNLSGFRLSDMVAFGGAIRGLAREANSMEAVAQRVVDYLYDNLRSTDGPSCALVRFYKTAAYSDVEDSVREAARALLGSEPDPRTRCLTLLATRGEQPSWNSRHASVGHKAIPLLDSSFIAGLPMVAEVFRQLGVDAASVSALNTGTLGPLAAQQLPVFLIERATDSPFIPAQQNFVIPFHVQSVIAFGGVLPDGELFVTLLFSKEPVTRGVADLFGPLSLNIKAAIQPHAGAPVFAAAPSSVVRGS